MKIILTGATGNVGGAVLQHCLANPAVTSLVVLSRRPLEGVSDPKLTTIIHKDFSRYDDKVIEQLKGAQGCIWALGAPTGGKEIHITYPRAAISAFLTHVVPALSPAQQPFRFVLTSGGLMPYLESPFLFFLGPWRTLRLDFEREVLALEKSHAGKWESFVARPWHVLDEADVGKWRMIKAFILKPQLGAAMMDAVLNGGGVERIMINEEMKERGQQVLDGLKQG